ncbi:PREDICTED: uncharacterized protein LOC105364328 [Ceratosolen solmsi marchali]|uniref:Uncharacterized protein LOC105364328 n=1 Tax=Ceratosolen solmsi marchali TaxID=326594 RepID=A0AAJ6YM19_9HYME|nr:PREDICTED: uncharacterized protein LOC105364328 [Ceratosolen solmsi marchali]
MKFLNIKNLDKDIEDNNFLWNNYDNRYNPIRIRHYRKSSSKTSNIYKISSNGSSKFVFICPPRKSAEREHVPNIFVHALRLILSGLIILDTFHIWPGEFLPNQIPVVPPPPLPPIKSNIIEPLWCDNC